MSRLMKAALWYARRGYAVFPCKVGDKGPAIPKSRGGAGCKDASVDLAQIRAWWQRRPYNIGIAAGASGLVMVDIDGGKRGWESLAELEERHGALPPTATVETAGGCHFYFKAPAIELKNSASALGQGIDTRAGNGYALAPPSIHPSGHVYAWEKGRGIHEIDLAPLPEWIAEQLRPPPVPERTTSVIDLPFATNRRDAYARAALSGECKGVQQAPEGTRNARLNIASLKVGQIVGSGLLDERLARGALIRAGMDAGLPMRECVLTVNSGISAGVRQPRQIREVARG